MYESIITVQEGDILRVFAGEIRYSFDCKPAYRIRFYATIVKSVLSASYDLSSYSYRFPATLETANHYIKEKIPPLLSWSIIVISRLSSFLVYYLWLIIFVYTKKFG
jgi:hypothetical protein